jgi:hypothetical protein
MWIGTDVIGWNHGQIESAICIGKDVTGSIHDQFEVLCDLENIIDDDVMT